MSGAVNRQAVVLELNSFSSRSDEDETDVSNLPVRYRKKKPPPIPNFNGTPELPKTVKDQVRHSYLILKNLTFPINYGENTPNNRETFLSEISTNLQEGGGRHFGYLTIRILLWDIMLSFLDTASDFAQGVALFSTPEKEIYGVVTLAINWIPGIPAAIHLISMYRTQFPWYSTLLYALLLIVLYPIVPILAFASMLWMKPKSDSLADENSFREAEYRSVIAHAISGCIESPIQLIYQMWLVLNGVVLLNWDEVKTLSVTDWEGNTVFLPITAAVSMIFSLLAIVKATLEANLIRVHIEGILTWKCWFFDFVPIVFDHLPLMVTGTFFRIASLILIMTYLNSFGFIPIAAFWLLNIVMSQYTFGSKTTTIPLWLISFIALFIPVCLTTKARKRANSKKKMISLQYKVFMIQSWLSFVCYGPSLIAMCVLINQPISNFKYNPDIVLHNTSFNITVGAVLVMGLVSTVLATLAPSSAKPLAWFSRENNEPRPNEDTVDKSQESSARKIIKLIWSWFLLALAISPVLAAFLLYKSAPGSVALTSYVFYKPGTHFTKILQATTLNNFEKVIFGTSKDLLHQGIETEDWQNGSPDVRGGEDPDNNSPQQHSQSGVDNRSPGKTEIVLISRTLWDLQREQILSTIRPAGVVITDFDRLRPSSPLPDLGTVDPSIPVLLVRMEDQDELPKYMDSLPIWLSPRNDSIPDPDWTCHNYGCLSEGFNEHGFIIGKQSRKKICTWGGHACLGYTNQPEEQPYCDGPETTVCPPDPSQGMGFFKVYTWNGAQRTLRFNPINLASNLEPILNECDRGTSIWTNWLRWAIEYQDRDKMYRSRRRYCYVKHIDCLVEEKMSGVCCDFDYEEDSPSPGSHCKSGSYLPKC